MSTSFVKLTTRSPVGRGGILVGTARTPNDTQALGPSFLRLALQRASGLLGAVDRSREKCDVRVIGLGIVRIPGAITADDDALHDRTLVAGEQGRVSRQQRCPLLIRQGASCGFELESCCLIVGPEDDEEGRSVVAMAEPPINVIRKQVAS